MSASAAALLVLAGRAAFWNLRTAPGLAVFGVLLVALSFVLSAFLDARTLARRRRRRPLLNRTSALARTVKLSLGGVVIPLAALVAANLVRLPDKRTPMAVALELSHATPAAQHETRLGAAVLRAQSPAAKVQGIRALQALGSDQALEQVLRVAREDPRALDGGAPSRALSLALASFGERAVPALVRLAGEAAPARSPAAEAAAGAAPEADRVACSFAAEIEDLKGAVERIADPAARAAEQARVARASDLLQSTLGGADPRLCPGTGGVDGFALGALLAMDVKENREALALARSVAADAGRAEPVRGRALLLVAKLGDKDDLEALFDQLDDPSPLLQARAMQAVAELQAKLNAAR